MATLAERLAPAISPGRAFPALKRWWAGWALTAVLAFLILYPLVALFQGSVQDRDGGAFSLDAYRTAFTSAETYELIWTTVWLAAVRVVPATVIGVFLAWVVARTDTPWRGGIELMMWIKFFAPPLPIVMAWVLLGGRTGILNQWLGELPFVEGPIFDVYSYAGIIWVSTFGVAAFIFLLTLPAFRALDASLEEAGRIAGATRLQVLRLITVPVLLPSVLGAVFLSFIFLLESFETEMILGVPRRIYVLSTRIYSLSEQSLRICLPRPRSAPSSSSRWRCSSSFRFGSSPGGPSSRCPAGAIRPRSPHWVSGDGSPLASASSTCSSPDSSPW